MDFTTIRTPPGSYSEEQRKVPCGSGRGRERVIIVKYPQSIHLKARDKILPELHPTWNKDIPPTLAPSTFHSNLRVEKQNQERPVKITARNTGPYNTETQDCESSLLSLTTTPKDSSIEKVDYS